jgi:hypothetical protein
MQLVQLTIIMSTTFNMDLTQKILTVKYIYDQGNYIDEYVTTARFLIKHVLYINFFHWCQGHGKKFVKASSTKPNQFLTLSQMYIIIPDVLNQYS